MSRIGYPKITLYLFHQTWGTCEVGWYPWYHKNTRITTSMFHRLKCNRTLELIPTPRFEVGWGWPIHTTRSLFETLQFCTYLTPIVVRLGFDGTGRNYDLCFFTFHLNNKNSWVSHLWTKDYNISVSCNFIYMYKKICLRAR